MDKTIKEFKSRRENRLRSRYGENYDSVMAFKARRSKRLDARSVKLDDEEWKTIKGTHVMMNDNGNVVKGPERLKKLPQKAKSSAAGKKATASSAVKGVTSQKSESGFEVPTFDEATFTDNIEEKKKIARQAAKKLVPEIKKTLSTEVKDISRPEVNEETRKYLRDAVSGVTDEQIDKALEESANIYKYWEENEPAITDTVVGAVKDVGGSMYGLDHRRKFDKSLAKKALADALDPSLPYNGDIALAASHIKDGARYTAIFDSDNFAKGYKRVKEALEKMGIREYRCKNFFTQYRDQDGSKGKIGEQKSVQCVFETPDGQKFELQFHTPESMAAKEVNHPTYKQKKEPASEHVEYNKPRSLFMRDTSSVVPDPQGVFDIEEHKRGETGYK